MSMLVVWLFIYLFYQSRANPCSLISKFLGFLSKAYTCFNKSFSDGLMNF